MGHAAPVDESQPLAVRSAEPADRAAMHALVADVGLFAAEELDEVGDTLDAFFSEQAGSDFWVVGVVGAAVVALGYYAPERMTRGTWNLYLLAVHPDHQGMGHGRGVVRFVEDDLRSRGARLLLIETSGVAEFHAQRDFYAGLVYRQEAVIRQFYDAGDDKVIFALDLGETHNPSA